jgi:hypothetical protein
VETTSVYQEFGWLIYDKLGIVSLGNFYEKFRRHLSFDLTSFLTEKQDRIGFEIYVAMFSFSFWLC